MHLKCSDKIKGKRKEKKRILKNRITYASLHEMAIPLTKMSEIIIQIVEKRKETERCSCGLYIRGGAIGGAAAPPIICKKWEEKEGKEEKRGRRRRRKRKEKKTKEGEGGEFYSIYRQSSSFEGHNIPLRPPLSMSADFLLRRSD